MLEKPKQMFSIIRRRLLLGHGDARRLRPSDAGVRGEHNPGVDAVPRRQSGLPLLRHVRRAG